MTLPLLALRGVLLLIAVTAMVTLAARGIDIAPDLLAVVIGAVALRGRWAAGAGVGLAGGWILDLMPPGAAVVGVSALLYAAGGALAGRLHRPGPVPWFLVVAAALAVTLVVDGVGVALALGRSGPVAWPVLAARLLATATVALVVGPLLLRADRRLDVESVRS